MERWYSIAEEWTRYAGTIDHLRLRLAHGADNLQCFVERDGIFVCNFGSALLSALKYYELVFEHDAGNGDFPEEEEKYMATARTTRYVKCADANEARRIADAMYHDPLYAEELLGKCLEIKETDLWTITASYVERSPRKLRQKTVLATQAAGILRCRIVSRNPLTVELPTHRELSERWIRNMSAR